MLLYHTMTEWHRQSGFPSLEVSEWPQCQENSFWRCVWLWPRRGLAMRSKRLRRAQKAVFRTIMQGFSWLGCECASQIIWGSEVRMLCSCLLSHKLFLLFWGAFIPHIQWRENVETGRLIMYISTHAFFLEPSRKQHFILVWHVETSIYLRKCFVEYKWG